MVNKATGEGAHEPTNLRNIVLSRFKNKMVRRYGCVVCLFSVLRTSSTFPSFFSDNFFLHGGKKKLYYYTMTYYAYMDAGVLLKLSGAVLLDLCVVLHGFEVCHCKEKFPFLVCDSDFF